ncbi:MAG: hypothetical protein VKK80_01975 [Prochlorothrix sp.]|nr:hypothetical protein [Prochlorothrix sp.]
MVGETCGGIRGLQWSLAAAVHDRFIQRAIALCDRRSDCPRRKASPPLDRLLQLAATPALVPRFSPALRSPRPSKPSDSAPDSGHRLR